MTAYHAASACAALAVLGIFARRASRLSLAHAFFLLLVVADHGLPGITYRWALNFFELEGSVRALTHSAIQFAFNLPVACTLAWLLGTYDVRSLQLRKRTNIAWLLGTYDVRSLQLRKRTNILLGALQLPLTAFAAAGALGLTYLVRLRPARTDNSANDTQQRWYGTLWTAASIIGVAYTVCYLAYWLYWWFQPVSL